MRPILILLLVTFAVQDLRGQRRCYKCKGEGYIACGKKDHNAKRLCGKWKFEHRCTPVYSARCCRGIQKIHCTRCNDPVAEAEIMEELESRLTWVKGQKAFLARSLVRGVTIETKDIRLHFMISRWVAKEARYTRSKAAHLFAYRLQQAADRFREVCGTAPGQRQTVAMCANEGENLNVTLHHMGGGYRIPFRRNSLSGMVATWPVPTQPRDLNDDENMHSHVVHLATHVMHWASVKFHMETVVWFDVGLAHWFELDQTEQTRNFCINETTGRNPWSMIDWKKKIYSEVSSGDGVKFATLLTRQNLDQTSHRDHAYCWSFVDYLIATNPTKFKKFYLEMKSQNDTKKALDKVYNLSTASVHDQWRKWVMKNYAPN